MNSGDIPDELLLKLTSGRARKPKRSKPSRVSSFHVKGSPATSASGLSKGRSSILKLSKFNAGRLGGGSAKAHLRYLLRESATKTIGSRIRTTGTVPLSDFEHLKPGEKRHFRAILSPGEDFFLQSELYVHAVMARLQQGAGRHNNGQILDWAAIRHDNTENPHWHILIHGLAADGEDVYLGRSLVTTASLMASAVQHNLTGGIVLSHKVVAERKRAPTWETMKGLGQNNLDRVIEEKGTGLTRQQLLDEVSPSRQHAMHVRLLRHESAGLVLWTQDGVLQVPKDFYAKQRTQRRLLRAVAGANVTLHTDPRSIRLVDSEANPRWSKRGVVTRRVRVFPSGDLYFLVEGVDDKPYLMKVSESVENLPPVGSLVRCVGGGLRVLKKYPPEVGELDLRKGGKVLENFGSQIYEALGEEVLLKLSSASVPPDHRGAPEPQRRQPTRSNTRDSLGW